ncbi:MAG TPA: carboxypeptidase-like regulatory domain-containing protein [Methanoculleus sp.]|nr:carboxypeptidase-like regulatory domain-containing protein [Methanoculleus sp.]
MNRRATHIILAAAAVLVLALLAGEAVDPVLYTAENISTAAHADPATIEKRSPGDAASVVPRMDGLLGDTGSITLTIKLKDFESAELDLARYRELSGQFDNLVVNLDVTGTDIGEFRRNNALNQEALAALLDDSRRLEDLKRLEIEVRDGEQRMAIAYEGEALRQKMREIFTAYADREAATIRIAEHYDLNATPYQESIRHFAEIVGTVDEWRQSSGGSSTVKSPLTIAVVPDRGRYGDVLTIGGAYTGGAPGTPVEIYVDSRNAATVALGDDRTYRHLYRIGRILAGSHLAYVVAGPVYSEVAAFEVLPDNTTITLAVAGVNRTTVACSGSLTAEGRPVTGAPVVLRVDGETLATAETDQNGTYGRDLVLAPGEHTVRAEFHGAGFPLNPSTSRTETVTIEGEWFSPLPLAAALAAAAGTGWYLRRRWTEEAPAEPLPEEEVPIEPAAEDPPEVESAQDLPPREAATVLFRTLRARLGLPETKTPRDCALLFPAHAGFFERYEAIRYAGETPTEEELRAMEAEARGGDEDAA